MDARNEVLYRVYGLLYAIIIPIALVLAWRTLDIAVISSGDLKGEQNNFFKEVEIVPQRGNIYSADDNLLATSVPFFSVHFDPWIADSRLYYEKIDSLAVLLATHIDDSYTPGAWRDRLFMARDTSISGRRDHYMTIKNTVSYEQLRRLEEFPIFRNGRFRGGLIVEQLQERKRPFGLLARRTIGYANGRNQPVGIEGKFDEYLAGESGRQMMFKVSQRDDQWLPTEELTIIEPRSGDDVFTTLDVNMQDIAETALMRAMRTHRPEWGTAIVMDVQTGAIRAIANLGMTTDEKNYYEQYNYAVANATEPGSTFKLASMMALLEDGYVKLEDTVNIENGETMFYEAKMVDASYEAKHTDTTTVRRVFEMSSNVGMAKLVDRYYGGVESDGGNAREFMDRLKSFHLDLPTGIEIDGEASPYLKEPYSEEDQWSGLTLPWMATGYEVKLTPLQLLTFYNAVANNGRMMKPYLVREIRRNGERVIEYRPTVIDKAIAGKRTIQNARKLLEGVVIRGTARALASKRYSFAGKTGTAQLNYRRGSNGTRVGGYQASFAGYFPADKPRYSCVVVIYKPSEGEFYGSDVAGPVFREIADKAYNSMIELHDPINRGPRPVLYAENLPRRDIGDARDIYTVLDYLRLPYYGQPEARLAAITASQDSLLLYGRSLPEETMPDVTGMGLRDALFELENRGLTVKTQGVGRVTRQSLLVGTRLRGQEVLLILGSG